MKKKLCIIISVVLIFVSMPFHAFADDYSNATPIGDKYAYAAMLDNPRGNYYLTDDIVFTANDFKYGGDFFNSGNYFQAMDIFKGTLDGCGHTISGLKGDSAVAKTNNGSIKNLCLKNCNFSSGAVCNENAGSVYNCILNSSSSVGITELNNAVMDYCFSNDNDCGICDTNYGDISNCINNSALTEGGGIANNNYGSISFCINNGDILSDSSKVGGICGSNTSPNYGETGNDASVAYCINNGKITGVSSVGGICGVTWDGSVTNCLNTATISATTRLNNIRGPQYWSSGISELQYNAKTICCVNIGSVNAGSGAAVSLVRDYENGSIIDSYYLSNTGTVSDDTTATAVSSASISKESSFPSLDFDCDWKISESKPTLRFTEQNLIGASIYSQPNKLYYDIDEAFDSTGLSVITYDNLGNWLNTDDYEISGYSGNFGVNKISVTTNGYTNKFSVFVQDKIENCTVEAIVPVTETGKTIEPIPNIISPRGDLLEYGEDYILEYQNNTEIGIAKILIKGIGLYKGSVYTEFLITPEKRLEIANVPDKYYYSYGDELDTTGLVVREFTDDGLWHIIDSYDVSGYSGTLGINTVTVSNDGFEARFNVIVQEYICNTNISLTKDKFTATQKEICPTVIITNRNGEVLEKDKDYILEYQNNIYPGLATVTIIGINNYKEKATKDFIIVPMKTSGLTQKSVNEQSVSINWAAQNGVDGYIVEQYNNSNNAYIETENTSSAYSLITNLLPSTEYKFRVRSYKKINGTTYYGDYSDTLTVKTAAIQKTVGFKIASKSEQKVNLCWSKNNIADGYSIEKYDTKSKKYKIYKNVNTNSVTVSGLSPSTYYKFRVRAYKVINGKTHYGAYSEVLSVKTSAIKVSGTSLYSMTKKTAAFTAKWRKQSSANGYQLQYSTFSSFESAKNISFSKNKTTSATVMNLKGGKKYYVRIRCYKTIGKKKYYSSWSKAKTVKVKTKNKF